MLKTVYMFVLMYLECFWVCCAVQGGAGAADYEAGEGEGGP